MLPDALSRVVHPDNIEGSFDLVFAMAVLQRQPHKIAELGVDDLSPYYAYDRFNAAVRFMDGLLRPGGLLCVINAQYRIEDSSVAGNLEPVCASPLMDEPLFGPDGRLLDDPVAHTIFRKLDPAMRPGHRLSG